MEGWLVFHFKAVNAYLEAEDQAHTKHKSQCLREQKQATPQRLSRCTLYTYTPFTWQFQNGLN